MIYIPLPGRSGPRAVAEELWSSDCTIRLRGVLIAYVVMISPKLGSRLAPGRQPGCAMGTTSECCHLQYDGVMLDHQHGAYRFWFGPKTPPDEATRILKLRDLRECQKVVLLF